MTPSLNKSFKFQSDWPYNNSQVYLINSIIEDLKEDERVEFKVLDNGYFFSSSVNYPNNKALVRQNVYVLKNGKISKTEVLDKDGNVSIAMKFNNIEYNKKFDDKYFELSSLLKFSNTNNENKTYDNESDEGSNSNGGDNNKKSNSNTNNSSANNDINNGNVTNNSGTNNDINNGDTNSNNGSGTTTNNSNDNNSEVDKTKSTASINDIVYPMYLPNNTYLTNQERINTKNGERLILTFSGDSSFVLVEETGNIEKENVVIPVSGEFDFLTDVIGIIGSHSLSWNSNGIDYYIASDVIETAELIDIARSINVLPVSK